MQSVILSNVSAFLTGVVEGSNWALIDITTREILDSGTATTPFVEISARDVISENVVIRIRHPGYLPVEIIHPFYHGDVSDFIVCQMMDPGFYTEPEICVEEDYTLPTLPLKE